MIETRWDKEADIVLLGCGAVGAAAARSRRGVDIAMVVARGAFMAIFSSWFLLFGSELR